MLPDIEVPSIRGVIVPLLILCHLKKIPLPGRPLSFTSFLSPVPCVSLHSLASELCFGCGHCGPFPLLFSLSSPSLPSLFFGSLGALRPLPAFSQAFIFKALSAFTAALLCLLTSRRSISFTAFHPTSRSHWGTTTVEIANSLLPPAASSLRLSQIFGFQLQLSLFFILNSFGWETQARYTKTKHGTKASVEVLWEGRVWQTVKTLVLGSFRPTPCDFAVLGN